MNYADLAYWYFALTMACVSGDGSYLSLLLNKFTIFIESLVKPVRQKKFNPSVKQENSIFIVYFLFIFYFSLFANPVFCIMTIKIAVQQNHFY